MKRLGAVLLLFLAGISPARADPQFPDIDSLQAVDVNDYANPDDTYQGGQRPDPRGWLYAFTVGGISCIDYPWHFYGSLTCEGRLSGAPEGAKRVSVRYAKGSGSPGGFVAEADITEPMPKLPPDQVHELPIGRKVLFENHAIGADPLDRSLTCGVPEPYVLACRMVKDDVPHGFVLSPDGSWVF